MGAAKRDAAAEKRRQIASAEGVARDRHLRSVQSSPPHAAPVKTPVFIAPLPDIRWQRYKPVVAVRPVTPETFHVAVNRDGVNVHYDGECRACPSANQAAGWVLSVAGLPHEWCAALAWELRQRTHWILHDADILEWAESRS